MKFFKQTGLAMAAVAVCLVTISVGTPAQPKLKPLPRFLRNAKLADRYLRTRDIEDILQFERAEPVCLQLLSRDGVSEAHRMEALTALAELRKSDAVAQLVAAIDAVDTKKTPTLRAELSVLLPKLSPESLVKRRDAIQPYASDTDPKVQQSALAAMMEADGSIQQVWKASADSLECTIQAFGLLQSDALRTEAYRAVLPLLIPDSKGSHRIAAVQIVPRLNGDMKPVSNLLADLIGAGRNVPQCIVALRQIPVADRSNDGESLFGHVFDYASTLSIAERTQGSGAEAIALLKEIADASASASLNERFRRLAVQIFHVTTVKEQMQYDNDVLIVESGRAVKIVFKNDDIMPHNLVIGSKPEARVELGLLADDVQGDKDAATRGYLPDSDLVMHASKMIQPGVVDTIEYIAPAVGVYPFVCTFPGHWSKMYGAIKVVGNAETYLANKQPLPTADELLGIRKVAWMYDDLVSDLGKVMTGRSFTNGKRLFRRASCYSCHKIKDEGGVIGPDLTEIAKKYKTPSEVLLHIMEPSKDIDPKFASLTVIDDDGVTHQGVVVYRTEQQLHLKKNPLEDCEPTVIRVDEIDEELVSKVSPMPEKLLNTIVERGDIYDLLSYAFFGGDEGHPAFTEH